MTDLLLFVLGIGVGGLMAGVVIIFVRPGRADPAWSVRSIQARLEYEQTVGHESVARPVPLRDRRTA
ncbi:hypothetical protein [Nocardia cyriacigeorgica]|uniref:hypothetical protein n=1 Tax=Nocardia cyriacigeorgica TaxID=135487 RepID=UPI002458DA51|nr:hypothetical protein [Nocardia cyriacigeorgica]